MIDVQVNFMPIENRVLLKMDDESDKTAGGLLYKPDSAKETPVVGTVVAVGEGKWMPDGSRRRIYVNVGDRVFIGKWIGQEIIVDDVKYKILFDEDILGVHVAANRENSA